MGDERTYVVLAKSADGRTISEAGRYPAVDSESAIKQGIESYVANGRTDIDGEEPSAWIAISKRNWVELPVVREVQTRLRIGEREFVLDHDATARENAVSPEATRAVG